MENFDEQIARKEELDEANVIRILLTLDDAYFNDEELVSDAKYDELKRYAQITFPFNGYFKQVGSSVRGEEIKHSSPVGGLYQVHEGDLLKAWGPTLIDKSHVISEKLDGASATLTYVGGKLRCAATRGDGVHGKDITRHIINLPSVPQEILECADPSFDIRGEVIIRKENFDAIKEVLLRTKGRDYKNLRNTVNGLLNASEIPEEVYPFIEFVAYDMVGSKFDKDDQFYILEERYGFQVPRNIFFVSISEQVLTKVLNEFRQDSIYEIDGVVVELVEYEDRKDYFPSEKDPNPGYAFKWKVSADDNLAIGHVIDVEWNVSKHNMAKPVVLIEPVDINGITVQRLSGFNGAFIYNSGIGPGAQVKFTRSGDVIPHILETVVKVQPAMPSDVDWEWNETQVDIVVIDPTPEAELKRQTYFFTTLKVDGLKEASVEKLWENGEREIADIIDMSRDYMIEVLGKNGGKIYDSLEHRLKTIELDTLIGAWPYFGRGFGVRKSRALLEVVGDNWRTCTLEDILQVEGFSDKTAQVFLKDRQRFIEFVDWLYKIDYVIPVPVFNQVSSTGPLSNVSFAFTGVRLKEPETLKLQSLGGIIHDGVKKDTSYLVAKDPNAKSNKLDKARDQGTTVISLEQLMSMINK